MLPDLIWTLAAFFLTILVLSYVLGDNELFRLVIMIFVGVTAGYGAVLIYYQILLPRLITPLLRDPMNEKLVLAVPAILGILLLFKLTKRLTSLGNPAMALMTGVGAAVAIGGAITGTIFGQIEGAIAPFSLVSLQPGETVADQLLSGVVLLVGTSASLAYFHFGARKQSKQQTVTQPVLVKILGQIGQVFIAITLGSVFAGVLAASLAALIERMDFILSVLKPFLS